jgi:nitrate/nitrite-specific signal transduction histidine kinase
MMKMLKFLNFDFTSSDNEQLPEEQKNLHRILSSAVSYIPLMLAFNFFGFVLIYLLALVGLLDYADLKLLGVAAVSLITAALHIPISHLLKKNHLNSVVLALFLLDGSASAFQIFLWQGTAPFIFFSMTAISPAIIFLPLGGIKIRLKIVIIGIAALLAISMYGLNNSLAYPRLEKSNLSTMAGLTIYATVIIAMVTLVVTNAIQFRTIVARLIITFAFITLVSATSTLVVSGLVNLFRDRNQTIQQLQAISELKSAQMFAVLQEYEKTATSSNIRDELLRQRILYLLDGKINTLTYKLNYELVHSAITQTANQAQEYQELFIFDDSGRVVVSNIKSNESQVISGEKFFTAAAKGQRYSIDNNPFASQQSIIILTRIERNGKFMGAFATKISLETIRPIFETESNLGDTLETYLVGDDYYTLSKTKGGESVFVETFATIGALSSRIPSGSGIYNNYDDTSVLGYYQFLPELGSVFVSEIEQNEVTQKILELLFTNISVGVFTALMSLSIVWVISRSISRPVVYLAQKATQLAQGDLSTRISVEQSDEIGVLASAFNSVASELQTLIQTLEQKVTDRTEDLQKQANRLRVAAEVSRDAITSQGLDEILNRSAQLVMDRFGFYHTGIFLIDPQGEFAVLRASPTEAGQEMIKREHRLKIGQVGIVGYVADVGEPRVALDTGQDVTYFNNPLLPNTRSEMALPLTVNNKIIGVLDVQSEKSDAFSQEDIATLQIMADQLALAIQRAQFSDELQRNLQELEYAYQRFTLSSWRDISQESEKRIGYKYDGAQITSVETPNKELAQALRQGKSIVKSLPTDESGNKKTTLAIPVKVREQIIGAVNLEFATESLPQDTIKLVEDLSNRLAMSLENARLYTETQRLASNERMAGEISTKIGSSINVETILRTTVQELGRFAPGAEITLRLGKDKED